MVLRHGNRFKKLAATTVVSGVIKANSLALEKSSTGPVIGTPDSFSSLPFCPVSRIFRARPLQRSIACSCLTRYAVSYTILPDLPNQGHDPAQTDLVSAMARSDVIEDTMKHHVPKYTSILCRGIVIGRMRSRMPGITGIRCEDAFGHKRRKSGTSSVCFDKRAIAPTMISKKSSGI